MADVKKMEELPSVFDDGDAHPPTIHRIRANSTIMQLKKILGE